MGYIPIFLYLGSFLFLFVLVVNNSIKSKKKQYQESLGKLLDVLKENGKAFPEMASTTLPSNLEGAEKYYASLKETAGEEKTTLLRQRVRPLLGRVRQQQYWYNNTIKTKPYSFVAGLFGHSPM